MDQIQIHLACGRAAQRGCGLIITNKSGAINLRPGFVYDETDHIIIGYDVNQIEEEAEIINTSEITNIEVLEFEDCSDPVTMAARYAVTEGLAPEDSNGLGILEFLNA
jgi:hypothetical protein